MVGPQSEGTDTIACVLYKWAGNRMQMQVVYACIFDGNTAEIRSEILLDIHTKIRTDILLEIHTKILSDILLDIRTYTD